jgi:putative transposase
MPLLHAAPVHVTDRERQQLEALVRQQTCPQQIAVRARIILLAGRGAGVRPTADELGIGRSTVQAWRRRWSENPGASVAERLSDAPRPGTPPTFTPEQVCGIIALACEPPQDSGRPITHWTQREIADEAIKRGIVAGISSRSVGRFLIKKGTSSRIARAAGSTPRRTRGSPKSATTSARPTAWHPFGRRRESRQSRLTK